MMSLPLFVNLFLTMIQIFPRQLQRRERSYQLEEHMSTRVKSGQVTFENGTCDPLLGWHALSFSDPYTVRRAHLRRPLLARFYHEYLVIMLTARRQAARS